MNEECAAEHHLLVVWERGSHCRKRILDDLRKHFEVLYVRDLQWPAGDFEANLIKLYDNHDIRRFLEGKVSRIGTGPFTAIVVRDEHPCFGQRDTTHGPDRVNTNIFDKKVEYRSWIGHNALHATDTQCEAQRSIRLLFLELLTDPGQEEEQLLGMLDCPAR